MAQGKKLSPSKIFLVILCVVAWGLFWGMMLSPDRRYQQEFEVQQKIEQDSAAFEKSATRFKGEPLTDKEKATIRRMTEEDARKK